jgi:hypothetical protein
VNINTLESTLSDLETQLQNLKSLKPEVKPERLLQISSKIATLKAIILDSKEAYSTYLKASEALKKALKNQTTAQASYELAVVSEATADTSLTAKQDALAALEVIKASKSTSLVNLQELFNKSKVAADIADASLTEQKQVKTNAESALAIRQEQYSIASAKLSLAQQTFNEASLELEISQQQLATSNQILSQKQQKLSQAQNNYDTNLIPDPAWIPPTYQKEHILSITNTREVEVRTLVPHTTYITTGGVKAEVFNRRGYNNAPPLPTDSEQPVYTTTVPEINFQWGGGQVLGSGYSEDVIVKFTGNLLFPQDGNYRFYTPADDGTKLNIAGMELINDWRDKGGGGSTSQEVFIRGGVLYPFTLYYYENGGGANVWMYYYTPQTNYQLVPASYLGNSVEAVTTYEEVITYTYENYYTYETYYTTELVPNQTAPLIKDLNLKELLDSAQLTYNEALVSSQAAQQAYEAQLLTKNIASDELTSAQEDLNNSSTNKLNAEDELAAQLSKLNRLVASNEAVYSELTIASNNVAIGEEELTTAANNVTTASSEVAAAELELSRTTNEKAVATTSLNNYSSEVTAAQITETQTASVASALTLEASTKATETKEDIATAPNDTVPVPEPEPIPEEGSKEIPADLSADNLLSIDLTKVDPTELTTAQAEQLVEAALETFETATEGSPEYEQALDALYLAAEQDDIELSPELAAIPGLTGAVEVLNFLGNAGADMSPKVREESEKVVVATVVAAGAAIQSAAAAASTASASSGGSRRIGK